MDLFLLFLNLNIYFSSYLYIQNSFLNFLHFIISSYSIIDKNMIPDDNIYCEWNFEN